jgi:hypothetical protein
MNHTVNSRANVRKLGRVGGLLLAVVLSLLGAVVMAQDDPPQVGLLIVGPEDDDLITACVRLDEETLTGLQLLQEAGVDHVLSTEGGAVCSLDGAGCPATACFCECQGTPCRYWSYYHLDADGTWAYSGVGAGAWTLRRGDVDAWIWGDGSQPPPSLRFEDICPAEPETSQVAKSTLPPEARSTPLSTPETETTPESRIYLPGVSGNRSQPAPQNPLARVLVWLDQGYRGFLLILLALLALALLKWGRGENKRGS